MKKLILCLSVLGFAWAAQADRVVFEQATKKHAFDYRVESIGYYKEKSNSAGLAVWLSVPDVWPDPRITPEPPKNRTYLDTYEIKGLSFDASIGKRGAIVYNDGAAKTVCAIKGFIGFKKTGACVIELKETWHDYKIALRLAGK